jgi:hypothetical protein
VTSSHLGQWKLRGRENLCDKEGKICSGRLVIYISEWLNLGGGKLHTDYVMQHRTEGGLLRSYGLINLSNFGSKTASIVGAKSYEKTVVTS